MGDKEIPPESTIFGAFYEFERDKSSPPSTNPNVWNQSYTVKFKKVSAQKQSKSLKTMSSSSSMAELPSIPFGTFSDISLQLDPETKGVLRLLGVLHELNSKWPRILNWARPDLVGSDSNLGLASLSPSAFLNSKITAKLSRQMDEPLIVASRVLPSWCNTICHDYSFLVPFDTRLTHLQSHSFGYSRNMARWQQQQNSSPSNTSNDSPLLGRIQRQKVRISRDRVLDSMVKVMESFASTQALLEVEFFDEVGTGLGPTLEFFSLVCQEYRKSSGVESVSMEHPLKLWRSHGDPSSKFLNSLFPMPMARESQDSETGK
jgi:E3 ubiquitin-protein ligase TRIP12